MKPCARCRDLYKPKKKVDRRHQRRRSRLDLRDLEAWSEGYDDIVPVEYVPNPRMVAGPSRAQRPGIPWLC